MFKLSSIRRTNIKLLSFKSVGPKTFVIMTALVLPLVSIGYNSIASASAENCTFGTLVPASEVQPDSVNIFIGGGVTDTTTSPEQIAVTGANGKTAEFIVDKCGQTFIAYKGAPEQTYPNWNWTSKGVGLAYGGLTTTTGSGLLQNVDPPVGIGVENGYEWMSTLTTKNVTYPSNSLYVRCLEFTANPNTPSQSQNFIVFNPVNHTWVAATSTCVVPS